MPCQDAVLRSLHGSQEPINAVMQNPEHVTSPRTSSVHVQLSHKSNLALVTSNVPILTAAGMETLTGVGAQFMSSPTQTSSVDSHHSGRS